MKSRSLAVFLAAAGLAGTVIAASDPAPAVDPPELIALRDGYTAALAPIRAKIAEAIKARSAQYALALQKVEEQAAATNRLEAIPLLRAEREAFAAGKWTSGFPEDDKKIPSAARELRRAFDRDATKIRADSVPSARPILNDYLRKLDELDRRFVAAKAVDGALAVRQEKQSLQAAGADPLNGTNSLIVGKWVDDHGKTLDFQSNGNVEGVNTNIGGKWMWTDRARRAARLNWRAGPKFFVDLVVSPDGNQMAGVESGHPRNFTRQER